MLTPLETLPGWPAAPDPSVLHILGLLAGVPLLIALAISTASYLSSTHDVRRFGPPADPTTTFAGAPGTQLAAEEAPAGIEAGPGSDAEVGGVSARW